MLDLKIDLFDEEHPVFYHEHTEGSVRVFDINGDGEWKDCTVEGLPRAVSEVICWHSSEQVQPWHYLCGDKNHVLGVVHVSDPCSTYYRLLFDHKAHSCR